MKITDLEVIRLRSPEHSRPLKPAWTPGGSRKAPSPPSCASTPTRASSAGARPATRDSPIARELDQAAADRPGPVRARAARADLPQRRRRLGRRDRALGHHRQGVRPAALQALGRLPRPRARLRQLRRAALRRAARRGRRRAPRRGLAGDEAAAARLDDRGGHRPGRGGPRARWATTSSILVDANQAQQPGTPQPEEGPVWTLRARRCRPRASSSGWASSGSRSRSTATTSRG